MRHLRHLILFIDFRSGASKQNLEGTILEEVSCFCDAIREENGKTFSIKVGADADREHFTL